MSEASSLEALAESMAAIAPKLDVDEILELTRSEAERLFGAAASILEPGAGSSEARGSEPRASGGSGAPLVVPLRVHETELACLRIERTLPFGRAEAVEAELLAGFAGRTIETAQLLAEARVREAERARLSDQLITAEQEERRRLAVFLHDTAVQSLSGIALMLDAGLHSIAAGNGDEARTVIGSALERHRDTIRSLRDLSFNLEPVVLRDQGFTPAVNALAQQLGLERRVRIELDVAAAEHLGERAQATLYQIIREALHGAIRRGPPSRISVTVSRSTDGGVEMVIVDDAPGERRQRSYEGIAERARALSGRVHLDAGADGGTTLRVTLPHYSSGGEPRFPPSPLLDGAP